MNSISLQIETLRQKLLETVDSYRGDFLHPNVLRISQELDMLIVEVQSGERKQRQPSVGIGRESGHADM
ncbi:aspartyl-phosphate phosphatase Spo0E family protein [Tumebacillus algifaecis]|nr:aspartyl-phosphate phosphatase Spo0E family protein [Tumebacillus algifaecis]